MDTGSDPISIVVPGRVRSFLRYTLLNNTSIFGVQYSICYIQLKRHNRLRLTVAPF